MTWIFNLIGAQYLPVEFFAIFKRTGAIIGAVIVDKYISKKEHNILLKDKLILLVILTIGIYLSMR